MTSELDCSLVDFKTVMPARTILFSPYVRTYYFLKGFRLLIFLFTL